MLEENIISALQGRHNKGLSGSDSNCSGLKANENQTKKLLYKLKFPFISRLLSFLFYKVFLWWLF